MSEAIQAVLAKAAIVGAEISAGGIIVDDYQVTMEAIEDGTRLIVRRGNDVQTMDILNGANVVDITIEEVE